MNASSQHPDEDAPHRDGPDNSIWRLLVLDANPDDPMWIIASVTLASDVKPAAMYGRRYTDWDEVTAWVRDRVAGAGKVSLVPVAVACWRIDVGAPR